MTKMNKIWIAVGTLIYPDIRATTTVSKAQIDAKIQTMFAATISPVMITHHLVGSEDRQRDKNNPQRGGSRNRYLTRDAAGRFRLYRKADGVNDGRDKTGPFCPLAENICPKYQYLLKWYNSCYFESTQ